MALKVGIGQYWHASSFIHRLDPRTKLVCALVVMLSVFFVTTPVQLVATFLFAGVLCAAAKFPVRQLVRSIWPFVAMLGMLALINLLLVRGGTTLVSWGVFRITSEGVRVAVLYSLRMVLALVTAAVLLATTTQTQLTDALDAGLGKLSRFGVPGHELAMVFSLMLRFIPTLADEVRAILDAQTMRGGGLSEGGPVRRLHSLVPVMVALLASALRHADGIARALDARCYEPGRPRTHWHPLALTWRDPVAGACLVVWCTLLIALPQLISLFLSAGVTSFNLVVEFLDLRTLGIEIAVVCTFGL